MKFLTDAIASVLYKIGLKAKKDIEKNRKEIQDVRDVSDRLAKETKDESD